MIRKHPPKKDFMDKVFFGGNLGVQFGNITAVDISPLVGYKFTDQISAGVGATYLYFHYHEQYYDVTSNVYGGRVFGRYNFTENLFAHVEYEYLNLEMYDFPGKRIDEGNLLGGGGYIQRISDRSGFVAMVLYNFSNNAYSPYSSPIIFRVGFVAGI
ncbi:MAG: hypothetical protein WCJ33_08755 [Pseudomonadota bacterium]